MFCVYIINSLTHQKLYIGQTQNVKSRLDFHNAGRSKYTKPYRPWKLIAYKPCNTRSEAMAIERKMKNLKSKDSIFDYGKKIEFVWCEPDE